METLGRSVLDGTVFQKEDQQQQDWLKELSADGQVSPREALIQYIRHLESQEQQARSRQVVCDEQEDCFLFANHGPYTCAGECGSFPAKYQECPEVCHGVAVKAANCSVECDAVACPAGCTGCPHGGAEKPCLCEDGASSVEVLRDMAVHMEMAAAELERREIYQRADQLREVAGQLRQDARQTSLARASRKSACHCPQPPRLYAEVHGVGACGDASVRGVAVCDGPVFSHPVPLAPPRDVHAELRQLQEELRRTREELEQARQQQRDPLQR
jgi:hypothetical protein